MTLRGKYNGAKHTTEAWAVGVDLVIQKSIEDTLSRSTGKTVILRDEISAHGVGERRMRGEVAAGAAVDFIRVRMPE